ncbi:MAG: ECF transporter S component [Cellulosilyticaceae bacterium]
MNYLWISFIFLGIAFLPFVIHFERRAVTAEEVILIAVLSAIGAVARVPFAGIPSVQPTSFVIMLAAYVFGGEIGCLVGMLSALASNIFLGQGPWTPWQMAAWGLMGFMTGVMRRSPWMRSRIGMSIWGIVWGFVFGWIMNIWTVLTITDVPTWPFVLSVYGASFPLDLGHGIANAFLIGTLRERWGRILQRVRRKYGLLS